MNTECVELIKDDVMNETVKHSKGRVAPVGPQAIVVATYAAARHKRKTRRAVVRSNYNKEVPVDGFSLRKGELAFVDSDDAVRSNMNSTLSFSNIPTWTAWNRRSRTDPLPVFAGVVDKEWSEGKPNSDEAVTIRKSGTASIVNSGAGTIYHGESVYWNLPIRTVTGDPASTVAGIPKEKYCASVTNQRPGTRFLEKAMANENVLTDEFRAAMIAAGSPEGEVDGRLRQLADSVRDNFDDEMIAFLKKNLSNSPVRIGVALNTATRGAQLDVLLGY